MNNSQNSRKQGNRKQILKNVLRQSATNGNLESAISRLAKRGVLKRAALLAVEKQFAQGVPAVWMEDGVIYKVFPDGRKVKLASQKRFPTKLPQRRLYIQK